IVLMGVIKRFATGETIIREGESGNEMYVIIQGAADVYAGQGLGRRRVAQHRRGDVFGEMGLVRHHERSADVVAAADIEVLAIDESFLRRVQRRYPRIGSRVFLNLTRILCDRLEMLTQQFIASPAVRSSEAL